MNALTQRTTGIALGTLCLIVAVIWFSLRVPLPAHPVLIQDPKDFEFPKASLFDRCVPQNWGWLWRLRDKLFPRRLIALDSKLLLLKGPVTNLSDHMGQTTLDMYTTNGFQIWTFTQEGKEQLIKNLNSAEVEILSAPRVMTADTILSTLSVGSQLMTPRGPVTNGTQISMYPHVLNHLTDLTFLIATTEAITNSNSVSDSGPETSFKVNLQIAGRLSVPGQGGVLLFQDEADHPGGTLFGVLITTDSPTHKH